VLEWVCSEVENMTSTESASRSRLVTVDGYGRLHPMEGQPVDVIADQLFSVIVLWAVNDGASWIGWLTTIGRQFVRFEAADLEDPVFQSWLRALPGPRKTMASDDVPRSLSSLATSTRRIALHADATRSI
jgi:hypothetical protein